MTVNIVLDLFPTFKVDGEQFQIIAREGSSGYDIAVVYDKGDIGWGGENKSIIVECVDAAKIMQYYPGFGEGRRAFLSFIKAEALVRAKKHLHEAKPPPPDRDTEKVDNTIWNMMYSMHSREDGSDIDIDSPPLP